MTRMFAIVNTSNWSDEPVRVSGENVDAVLAPGEVGPDIGLTVGAAKTLEVEALVSDNRLPAPFRNKAGTQVFPFAFVKWGSAREKADMEDRDKDALIAELEKQVKSMEAALVLKDAEIGNLNTRLVRQGTLLINKPDD